MLFLTLHFCLFPCFDECFVHCIDCRLFCFVCCWHFSHFLIFENVVFLTEYTCMSGVGCVHLSAVAHNARKEGTRCPISRGTCNCEFPYMTRIMGHKFWFSIGAVRFLIDEPSIQPSIPCSYGIF